jgi:hypothetical protein
LLAAGNLKCKRGCRLGSQPRGRSRHSIEGKTQERLFSLSRVKSPGEEKRLQKRINPSKATVVEMPESKEAGPSQASNDMGGKAFSREKADSF